MRLGAHTYLLAVEATSARAWRMSLAASTPRVGAATAATGSRRVPARRVWLRPTGRAHGRVGGDAERRRPVGAIAPSGFGPDAAARRGSGSSSTESSTETSDDASDNESRATRSSSPWPILDALDDAREVLRHDPKRDPPSALAEMHWTLSDPSPAPRAVVRAVAEAARVSAALAEELVDMGAVYVDDWPEGRPEARGESSESDESSAAARARLFGWSYVEGVSPPPTQALSKAKKKARWTRVRDRAYVVLAHQRVRVHAHPRRYRDGCWLGAAAWRARVVYEDADLFVVNKPARLPTQAHESNGCECVPGCVERALGIEPGTLRVTHRLDASTSGVVVLAKHRAAAAAFNDALQRGGANFAKRVNKRKKPPAPARRTWRTSATRVEKTETKTETSRQSGDKVETKTSMTKTYVALTSGRESLFASPRMASGSEVTHWMYPGPFGPEALGGAGFKRSQARFLRAADVDGEFLVVNGEERKTTWKKCVLRVLSCEPADEETARRWHETHEAAVRASHKAPPARWLRRKPPASFDAGAKDSFRVKRNGRSGPSKTCIWRVRVELVTGRTHQVRAQLAALGHPLLGDSLYEPMRGYLHDGATPRGEGENGFEAAARRVAAGIVPDWPVALHAESLQWGEHRFEAPAPWDEPIDADYHYL